MFNNIEDIKQWMDKYGITKYTVNEDLTVDVDNSVILRSKQLQDFPVQFGIVNGDFDCSYNQLTSFKGIPHKINGCLYCSHNQLTHFDCFPTYIDKHIYCSGNLITNVNNFDCMFNGSFEHNIDNGKHIEGFENFYVADSAMPHIERLNISYTIFSKALLHKKLQHSIDNKTNIVKKIKI